MTRASWRKTAAIVLGTSLALIGGCKKTQSDADAIRAGITQHLTSLNTLNITAMDMDINNLSIQGTQAHAQVTFHSKGSSPDAGMKVAYQLEKRDSGWFVVKTEGIGGAMDHPAANTNPHLQPGQSEVHGNVPNLQEFLQSVKPANGALPEGHPPVKSDAQPTTTESSNSKSN